VNFYLETKIFMQICEKQFSCWWSTPRENPVPTVHKMRRKSKTRLKQSIFHCKLPAEPQVFRGHITLTNTRCKGEFLPLILAFVKIWCWIQQNITLLRNAHHRIIVYYESFGPTFGPICTVKQSKKNCLTL
jgi:hypothetical protein